MSLLADLRNFLSEHRSASHLLRRRSAPDEGHGEAQLSAFFHELWRIPVVNEDEIARSLYGEAANRNTNAYKKLKQRAVEELSGHLLLVGPHSPSFTARQRGIYRAYRELVVAELLRARNFKVSAVYFHKKALRKARKNGVSTVEMLCLDALAYHAGVQEGNVTLFNKYDKEYRQALLKVTSERDVSSKFVQIKLLGSASPAERLEKHRKIISFIDELDNNYSLALLSPQYAFVYFTIKLAGWSAISDHDETLKVADESIEYFSGLATKHPVPLSYFYMHKLMIYALRKDYENGVNVYKKCLLLTEVNLTNWYKLSELAFFFLLQNERYDAAVELYTSFMRSGSPRKMPARFREKWLVYRAYLYFLLETGEMTKAMESDPLGKFRLRKFLNSVPSFSKEKRGRNIPILLVQILFTIQRKDYDLVSERMEAIEKYTNRHLRKDENYRSNCFIKLLLLFPKHDFRYEEIDRRSKIWLRKLEQMPLEFANQSYEIELIPYEKLFSMLLAGLR